MKEINQVFFVAVIRDAVKCMERGTPSHTLSVF